MAKLIHPITFIDKLVKKNELGQPFTLSDHQREILRLAFDFDQDGRLPWDTILYSCIKKSGKTTLNGAITLAWVNSKKEKTIMDQSEIYREQRKRDDEILAAVQPRTQPPEGCKHKDDCLMTKVRSQDSPVFPSYCFSACELPGAINDPERK